jgi:hypothetical protein
MGYFVRGFGEATFKDSVDIPELDNKLYVLDTLTYDIRHGKIEFLTEEEYFEKDHLDSCELEGDVLAFLDILNPNIVKGSIEYFDDRDRCWAFIFNPETKAWKQELDVNDCDFETYTDEQMIKELIERGYAVSKIYSENRDYEWIVCKNDDGNVDITRFIGTKDEVKEHLLRIIQFGRSGVEQREFEINSVDDLRVIRGGWRVFAKEKYDEGMVEYSAIEVNHIFTT